MTTTNQEKVFEFKKGDQYGIFSSEGALIQDLAKRGEDFVGESLYKMITVLRSFTITIKIDYNE